MIKYTGYAAIFLFILVSCSKAPEQHDIKSGPLESPFQKTDFKPAEGKYTFNNGLKLVKNTGKILMVDFFADWCTYCKKMERETFMNPDVRKQLDKDYVRVRLHTDKPESDTIIFQKETMTIEQFSSLMGVQGLPTVLFIDKDENLITKIPGFIEKSVFLPLLNYIGKRCYEKKISFEVYMQDNKSCL